jgi:hypothetical protein
VILFPLLAIVGYIVVLTRATRWPAEVAPLVAISGIIIVLFWSGLNGMLVAGSVAVLIGGLIALCIGVVPRLFRRSLMDCVTPGVAAFVALVIFHWLRVGNAHLSSWDEFAHWGLQSKMITLTGALVSADSAVEFKDYPTGAALFHHFVNVATGYVEGNAIAAHGTITLAAIVTVLQRLRWRDSLAAFGLLLTAYQSVYALGQGFDTLLIDQVVGAVFGGTLATYFLTQDGRVSASLSAVPGLLVLPLLKEIGFQLALMAAGIVILDLATSYWTRRIVGRFGQRPAGLASGVAVCALILIFAPVASKMGWDQHRRNIQATDTFARPSPVETLRRSLSSQATNRDRVTLQAFANAVTNESLVIPDGIPVAQRLGVASPGLSFFLTTPFWLMLFAAFALPIATMQVDRAAATRASVVQICLALGFAAYALGHLIAYLDLFGEYEGTRVVSFARYMRTYLLGWAVAALAFVNLGWRGGWRPSLNRAVLGSLVALAIVFMPERGIRLLAHGPAPMIATRATLLQPLRRVEAAAGSGDKVYLLFQHTNGFEHWIAKYELAPLRTNLDCWSVGVPWGPDDVWTCPLTPSELAVRLKRYDYVFIGQTNDGFWDRFAPLFASGARSSVPALFAVQPGAGGLVALTAIDR